MSSPSTVPPNTTSPCTEHHRVSCALGGVYTALAIDKVLPVLHCGPGCLQQSRSLLSNFNGGQSTWSYPETIVPCTDFSESEVVFGGNERLRQVITHALEAYKADAVVAISGCTPAIVGDDVDEVVRSLDGDIPVLHAEAVGFKGNNLFGHTQVLASLTDRFLKPADAVNPKQVNVFGIVPFYDPFWEGTLEALEELLTLVGLEPNVLYGPGHGVENLKKIPAAGFNLLIGPWVDLELVQNLEQKFGTPFFHQTHLPIGPTETSKFLRRLADYAHLDTQVVEAYVAKEEKRYHYYVHKSLPWIYGCKLLPKEFIIQASAASALSLTKYLVNDMGLIPKAIYIAEGVPDTEEERLRGYFHDVELDFQDYPLVFTNDGALASVELTKEDLKARPVVFGTAWEESYTNSRKLPFIPFSAPLGSHLIGDKNYFGYRGATQLFTEFYSSTVGLGVDL